MSPKRLWLWGMLALGCVDPNGPFCDGEDRCLKYRASPESCPEFRTVPMPGNCRVRIRELVAAVWIPPDGVGCFSLADDASDPPPGYRFGGADHWCKDPIPDHCEYLPDECYGDPRDLEDG